ncbi:terpenoid cyclases/protein prenyltransferase alpha-alpha toroid [Tribonema minus]|uniref:Protein farnesyltransferase subunit beta n=1 Tax=Tribonema minus TaxID=303371 RepID=A0A836CMB6_9STRA|nr:terpenoid cyclases/protein prenyltransferase alpha-alpha toroid [Tribonema minus]
MEEYYKRLEVQTDGCPTRTTVDQAECERTCTVSMLPLHMDDLSDQEVLEFQNRGILNESGDIVLMRAKHIAYLRKGLKVLPAGFVALDASRPWIIYWITHSLDLLNALRSDDDAAIIATLASCQQPTGGFGGGPQQLAHCAPTYAAVLTLLLLGTEAAYSAVDRSALYRFFTSIKHPSGGFRMHEDGEVDVRGTYTVISIAALLNILTPELVQGVAEYVLAAQTYEGGFGGEPGNEAHGGYAFCAFATLGILGRASDARLDSLEWWLCHRQMRLEGGFQGRTNKLVDGCYSFWQGGTLALLEYVRRGRIGEVTLLRGGKEGGAIRPEHGESPEPGNFELLKYHDNIMLEGGKEGGAIRPEHGESPEPGNVILPEVPCMLGEVKLGADGSRRCYYVHAHGQMGADGVTTFMHMVSPAGVHSGALAYNQRDLQRYVLLCAQQPEGGLRDKPGKTRDFYHTCYNLSGLSVTQHCLTETPSVLGDSANELLPTNPLYNITEVKAAMAMAHFAKLPCEHDALMQQQQQRQ